MSAIDVFNGDADGLCALQQLRLSDPLDSTLVTGVKRDVSLLARVRASAGDQVTVLDVAVAANRDALVALLAAGVRVRWFDHHHPGALPAHPAFEPHVDVGADVCTSVLVDRHLHGAQTRWAIVGAFGDNLAAAARALGARLGLTDPQLHALRRLGEALNYNAYGDAESDLRIHPAELFRALRPYADPLRFAAGSDLVGELDAGRRADLAQAWACTPARADGAAQAYVLPDTPWARRVRGVFAHALASRSPDAAIAVVSANATGGYTASVRAPRGGRTDADTGAARRPATPTADAFCRGFGSGGGRAGAAGVNQLPPERLAEFLDRFARTYGDGGAATPSRRP